MFVKKIDPVGRFGIPKPILLQLNWKKGDSLRFYPNPQEGFLVLKKEEKQCCSCQSKNTLTEIKNGLYICKNCLEEKLSEFDTSNP